MLHALFPIPRLVGPLRYSRMHAVLRPQEAQGDTRFLGQPFEQAHLQPCESHRRVQGGRGQLHLISDEGHARILLREAKGYDRLRFRGLRRIVHQEEFILQVL